jgi:hypothetical protein
VSERPIRIVFDTSAILGFCRSSVDVGEVLTEVNDETAAAGLPILCLAEAGQRGAGADLLELLVNHDATVVLGLDPAHWQLLAEGSSLVGRIDAASAVLAADVCRALIMTSQPSLYAGLAGGAPLIAFPPR